MESMLGKYAAVHKHTVATLLHRTPTFQLDVRHKEKDAVTTTD